jgi:hypothetical protein
MNANVKRYYNNYNTWTINEEEYQKLKMLFPENQDLPETMK